MPFKPREKFERSDVWTYTPQLKYVSIGVLVAVAIGLVVLITNLWSMANKPSRVADSSLSTAISSQGSATSPQGYTFSSDSFTNLLILTVDSVTSDNPQLQKAQILTLNSSQNKAVLLEVPLDTKLVVGDAQASQTFLDCYNQNGASACIVPLAQAANIRVTHIILAEASLWDKVATMKLSGASALLNSSSELLASIKTDMAPSELLGVFQTIQRIGVGNFQAAQASVTQEDNGNGGTWSVLDATQTGLTLGLLVAAS